MAEQIQGWKKEMMKKNYKKKVVVPKYIRRIDKSAIGKGKVKKFYKKLKKDKYYQYAETGVQATGKVIKGVGTGIASGVKGGYKAIQKQRKGLLQSIKKGKFIDISKYTNVKVKKQEANQPNFFGNEDYYRQNVKPRIINPKQPFQSGGLSDVEQAVP